MFNENFFIVIAISYVAMLKKVFKLVFRNVSTFSVIFLRVQFKSVCLCTCFFTLIWLSVYPSPNFFFQFGLDVSVQNTVTVKRFSPIFLSLYLYLDFLSFSVFIFDPFVSIFFYIFYLPFFVSILLFWSFFFY